MEAYRVKQGSKFRLSNCDPDDRSAFEGSKEDGQKKLKKLLEEMELLQELLYAEHKHRLLVVLQAMDTGGKDGVIRRVFDGVNPQGVKVASFKVPTPIEADHDYLWRVHPHVPGKGEIVIFNRSHYEQVLVVRVRELEPEKAWRRHYRQICDFERMLTEEGVTILKFFLHISKEEQKQRLIERIQMTEKQWKFNPGDIDERKYWDAYMQAYEDAVRETSTQNAPWYVIPANRNWYRDLAIATILVKKLKELKMEYPRPVENIQQYTARLESEE